jgi:pimeloyl-ACP methyl ester carboxylesterase
MAPLPVRRRQKPRSRKSERFLLSAARRAFRWLDGLSPELAGRGAEMLFRTPPSCRPTEKERRILGRGTSAAVPFGGGRLATWTWGDGPPVLLVHGWGGHGGRLAAFVDPLLEARFSAIAFDAPGHGVSSGLQGSLPELIDAIRALDDRHGPFAGVIGHSLGASAVALAMRNGLRAPRAVFLAPPADMSWYVARFARRLHLTGRIHERLEQRLVKRYGFCWERMRVASVVADRQSRLLVFHDVADAAVPLSDGEAIASAWPGARLVRTRGLGHHRILRDRRVVAQATAFVARGVREAVPAARAV